MTIENNNNTKVIKNSLIDFINQLVLQKNLVGSSKFNIYMIDSKIPYSPSDKKELLAIARDGLRHLIASFKSVHDFDSVKKLREAELFFLSNKNFRKFTFPNYSSLINPNLLNYVNLEIELDALDKKSIELLDRGHKNTAIHINWVVSKVSQLIQCHFREGKINDPYYLKEALSILETARSILEQHRGCKKILGNLLLLILTLGTAHIANKMVNNHFLFFQETESSKQLKQFEHTVSKLTI